MITENCCLYQLISGHKLNNRSESMGNGRLSAAGNVNELMRLYYFTTEKFGLESIRDRRLKIARVRELNDPFEWISMTGNKIVRKGMQRLRNELDRDFGLICMSRNWQHPLLWGHYADKHKGLCLGFDVTTKAGFEEVSYISQRPDWMELRQSDSDQFNWNLLRRLYLLKFEAWDYETEFRSVTQLKTKDPVSDLYFRPFSEDMKLSQVIIGERCGGSRAKLDEVLGDLCNEIESFKARSSFKRFEMVRNMRKSMWK